ncbi:MAG: bifunctional phosphoribosylaminoimidazolecarboxamide formyltransferase/inosine monophosphate cyclohydrolase [Deltaproteobacteria bacterium]|nr:MAG: bifunctional phosphoribosylaminoimidazolecarboxamide formyltransferase/inosine monophosphate cyclohydrolase [Deltaproteobacteria bacterium]
MSDVQRALISVSNKAGIVEFAKELAAMQIEIISTGGTAAMLQKNGVPVVEISDYTGFPEIMDGRVKTLHPKIHGGLLALRDNPEHVKIMEEQGIPPIDMVVVNLYPFEETIKKPDCTLEEAIENIDIGGPTMLRSAAKNYRFVTVIIDPGDYETVLKELKENNRQVSDQLKMRLAQKVFTHTARYDSLISTYLDKVCYPETSFPETLFLNFKRKGILRYGENPHQQGSFYVDPTVDEPSIATAESLQGKPLSYNNIMDADAALSTVKEFDETACVIIKHANPCGTAIDRKDDVLAAYKKALACDPVSAFGGIIAINRPLPPELAEALMDHFVEVLIAPDYTDDALKILSKKKDLRILKIPLITPRRKDLFDLRKVVGGLLLQERDSHSLDIETFKTVTRRAPSEEEIQALKLAWKVCKHVKSNAIVYANAEQIVGVGAGQMSRVDSARFGIEKALLEIKGACMASDALIPFRDAVDVAAEAGITAIVQTGGSVRDKEVIAAADEHGMAMVFTGYRHFYH